MKKGGSSCMKGGMSCQKGGMKKRTMKKRGGMSCGPKKGGMSCGPKKGVMKKRTAKKGGKSFLERLGIKL